MLNTVHPAEVPVYPRLQLQPERGAGSTLVAADGRRFLDLYGGHAVAVSGHCHPRVVAAVCEQAERLLFYSNAVPAKVAFPAYRIYLYNDTTSAANVNVYVYRVRQ